MSDQQAPPQNGDSPAVAGPTEAPGTAQNQQAQDTPGQEVNWEQRYKDTQADYTRQQQEIAQLKQEREWATAALTSDDPDIIRQAAEILGLELPDEDNEEFEEYADDTDEQYMTKAEFEEFRRQEQAQQQQAQETEFIGSWAHDQFDSLGLDREDEQTRAFIFNQALSLPPLRPSPGMPTSWLPDVKTAYEQFEAWRDQQVTNWAKTKRAPHVPAGGLPANEVPNSGTGHEARMARAMRYIHNNEGDE